MNNFLIIDTRETLPYTFKSTDDYAVINEKLDFGDYAIKKDGKILCVFERKSSLDLYGSLTHGHNRFRDEILRAKESGITFFVIVEESYSNIINKNFAGAFNTKIKGFILAKILHTFMAKYNVHFVFCSNREEARNYIRNTFQAVLNLKV